MHYFTPCRLYFVIKSSLGVSPYLELSICQILSKFVDWFLHKIIKNKLIYAFLTSVRIHVSSSAIYVEFQQLTYSTKCRLLYIHYLQHIACVQLDPPAVPPISANTHTPCTQPCVEGSSRVHWKQLAWWSCSTPCQYNSSKRTRCWSRCGT